MPSSPSCTTTLAISIALIASLATPRAAPAQDASKPLFDPWEDEVEQAYSDHFMGSFYEIGARYLLSSASNSAYDGQGFDAGFRFAFPMYLGDFRLAYRFDNLQRGPAIASRGPLQNHSIGLTTGLHPFYILMLGSDWISYVAASLHIELGLGMQLGLLGDPGEERRRDLGFFWSWGAGFDLPLWDPDGGHAPWMTINYRNHRGDFDVSDQESIGLSLHSLLIGLAWRVNGLPF